MRIDMRDRLGDVARYGGYYYVIIKEQQMYKSIGLA